MRVAVFLEQDINVGGGFQQAYSVVDYIVRHPISGIEYVFFVSNKKNHEFLNNLGLENILIKQKFRCLLHRAVRKLLKISLGVLIPFQGYIDDILASRKIDLVYFLTPSHYAMCLRKHNYIVTIWDLCHRDWVEFPEVRNDLEFESREFLYRNILAKAVAVFVDAELSKGNMARRYGVDLERIYVTSFFPFEFSDSKSSDASDVSVCEKYSIKKPFIFYPAQFWHHKNHCYILEAMALLRENQPLEVVFVGNDYGYREFVEKRSKELGVDKRCHFLGFVPRVELESFYKNALALVMPTYFGPTNIPPLEAFYWGCPVCYSDLPGLREQVGEAAFLMDLKDPNSLIEYIDIILQGGEIVLSKLNEGREKLKEFSGERYFETFSKVLINYKDLMKCE
ncbi:MAG: glycosyltransferase family 4 protein [Synergistaceae bacterium]|jgi:glycosyltransferase involved in cell wall biosynthesis|nr:glycosyltransferase family 4 protein [Synergistaceae bacterium]